MESKYKRLKVDYGREDMYRRYKKKADNPVPYSLYAQILNDFNKEIVRLILEEHLDFKLPARLGMIRIIKFKPTVQINNETGDLESGKAINWGATNKLWAKDAEAKEKKILVYFLNDHSDGYLYKWKYTIHNSNVVNKGLYTFCTTRTNKKKLNTLLRDPEFKGDFYTS